MSLITLRVTVLFSLLITPRVYAECTPTLITTSNVRLGWNNPTQPEGTQVIGLQMSRQVNGRAWHNFPLLPPTTVQYEDTDLRFGNTYVYRLRIKGKLGSAPAIFSDYANEGNPGPCVKRVRVLP